MGKVILLIHLDSVTLEHLDLQLNLPGAVKEPQILVFRLEGPLFYANAPWPVFGTCAYIAGRGRSLTDMLWEGLKA